MVYMRVPTENGNADNVVGKGGGDRDEDAVGLSGWDGDEIFYRVILYWLLS